MAGTAFIGTSGFTYDHWEGVFYPEDVSKRRRLEYYSEQFPTVEVNSSFYHLPRQKTCEGWRERTPDGFRFAMKLSRFITHRRRLSDCREPLSTFLDAVAPLGPKLGPVLVQLPPKMRVDAAHLDRFLAECPQDRRWAVEFREPEWLCEEVYEVLDRHRAALVWHDILEDHPHRATSDFLYLRFHGTGNRYGGSYDRKTLEGHAGEIVKHGKEGRDAYVYFNNDLDGHAVQNARTLAGMVEV